MEDFDFDYYYQNHQVDFSWLKNQVSMNFDGDALMAVGENQSGELEIMKHLLNQFKKTIL